MKNELQSLAKMQSSHTRNNSLFCDSNDSLTREANKSFLYNRQNNMSKIEGLPGNTVLKLDLTAP